MRSASPRWVLVTACLGYAMVIIDTTAVNVALPALGAHLGGSLSGLQWTVDGYVLVFAALLILGGSLGDRLGSARTFRAGTALFVVASLGCALAPNLALLIVSRLFQGVGAAALAPACLALIARAYDSDAAARARATAIFVTAAGSPQAFGPLLGGALVQAVGWRAIFWINVPVGLLAVAMASRLDRPRTGEPDAASPRPALPVFGHLAAFVTIAALTGVIIEVPRRGFADPFVLSACVLVVVGGVGLLRHERTAGTPAISRELLVSAAGRYIWVGLLLFASYYGLNFVLTLYLQQHAGFSAFATGLVVLAAAGPIFALPLVSSAVVRQWGARRVLLIGVLSVALGAVCLSVGAVESPLGREIALGLLGVGLGLAVTPQITLVIEASPRAAVAQASGVLNAARQLGTVLGVAVLGSAASTSASAGRGVAVASTVAVVLAAVTVAIIVAPSLSATKRRLRARRLGANRSQM